MTTLTSGKSPATESGATLEFDLSGAGTAWGGTAGDTRGDGVVTRAIRVGTAIGPSADIPWTLTGLTVNGFYDMIWYNKRNSPGKTRHLNTGVTGFNVGNGVGASGPLDADKDQNFVGVQADGSGTISGTWFHLCPSCGAGLSAVAGVQVTAAVSEPAGFALAALSLLGLNGFRRRRNR